ncbi:hypothetical protein WJX72_011136 [[Myrmecia] bisecta]|uniref:Uncharacterized protein n=1 Tax=[Myrmecia] bisecta TaxID=41462 RepID=A0AAW1QSV4_9CHLO
MGRPITQACAFKDCDSHQSEENPEAGCTFNMQSLFGRRLQCCTELWACCPEHKKAAVNKILQDLPFHNQSQKHEQ